VIHLTEEQKESKYNAVLVGIPTFGMVSINFLASIKMSGKPIWTTEIVMPVVGKPVDVARNEIAAKAVEGNYGYVFFRDDDVNAPPDALIKLIGRMTPKQKAKPYEVAESVVGGVIYEKKKPPTPMVFRHDTAGGFEDWNFGDLVECDSIGMGCTVIPVGVFKKILDDGYDEFQCVNDYCPVNWTVRHGRDQKSCPTCGGPLAPVFFSTVILGHGADELKDIMIDLTEDTYFCILAKEHGIKIYADCGVQCEHECTETGTVYYYHSAVGSPVWQSEGKIDFWPRIDSKREPVINNEKKKKKNGKIGFNIGSGEFKKDHKFFSKGEWVDIDLYSESDFRCDIRDLRPAISKYGQADEIFASHVLEHINHSAVTATVRNWLKALKPGGHMYIEVPDAKIAMEKLIEADSNGSGAVDYALREWVVFGEQTREGQVHQTAITENKIRRVLKSCSGMIDRYKITRKDGVRFDNGLEYDALMVDVWKKKPPKKARKK